MKIVLLKDISAKGKQGQIVEVADGYAKNYLFPRELALPATPAAIKIAETRSEENTRRQARLQEELKDLAQRLEKEELLFKMRAGNKDRIHGSITNADIANKLSQLMNTEIDKKKIEMDEPLRHLGNHEVIINIAKGIEAKIKVVVEGSTISEDD